MHRLSKTLLSLALVGVMAGLAGCQNSTGELFAPTSDIHVGAINPSILQPKEASGGGSDSGGDSSSVEIEIPMLQVYFRINNGVSVFLDQYSVRFYTNSGQSLANGRFDFSGAMNTFIQAPAVKTLGQSDDSDGDSSGSGGSGGTSAAIRAQSGGESDTQQTVPEDVAGYTTLEVLTPAVFSYITRGTATTADDITPVIARISIHGRDINNKDISILAQTTLITTILKSSDS